MISVIYYIFMLILSWICFASSAHKNAKQFLNSDFDTSTFYCNELIFEIYMLLNPDSFYKVKQRKVKKLWYCCKIALWFCCIALPLTTSGKKLHRLTINVQESPKSRVLAYDGEGNTWRIMIWDVTYRCNNSQNI